MKRNFRTRLIGLLAALTLATPVSLAAPTSVGASDSLGGCGIGALPPLTTQQIYVEKVAPSGYFDLVRADATVTNLNVCIGTYHSGLTAILPVNIQQDGGQIFQLGWIKYAGDGEEKFVYVTGSASNIFTIGSYAPEIGHRYRFQIYATAGKVTFYIEDLTVGGYWWYRSSYDYTSVLKHAWWGCERGDKSSHMGYSAFGPAMNMAYMGYSYNSSTTIWYRSGMGSGDVKVGYPAGHPIEAEVHGHIGTWVYGGDMFNCEHHN